MLKTLCLYCQVLSSKQDDAGHVHCADYGRLAFFSFKAYEKNRVKAFKFFRSDSLLITISTEGFVTVWQIDFILERLADISGDIELTEKIEPLYTFEIESRLICLDCKLEKKKGRNGEEAEGEKTVTIKSRTLDNNRGFIGRITKKAKKVTRISAMGGRRGAQNLVKLKKFCFVGKLKQAKMNQPKEPN